MNDDAKHIELRTSLAALESAAMNFSFRFIPDAQIRAEYNVKARQLSAEIVREVKAGSISHAEGARRASELRNMLMDALRGKSSEIGRAYASQQKMAGRTLSELEVTYARKLYGRPFHLLSGPQTNRVWKEIVFSAGRPQTKANRLAKILGLAGKSFIAITLTVAVYNIATAEDKIHAAANEGAVLGGGLLGSIAAGAAAGLMCGPGAPICVGIGIFVGGVMFAVSADIAYDTFWGYQ